jgi:CMP-N,N'-diacetyllegionaminic acid synthase
MTMAAKSSSGPFILALIPARSGSKGIPNKNIVKLAGKPLINYSVEAALACPLVGDCIVSTDSKAIADVAASAGAKIPFLRPAELATDDAKTIDVVIHAIETYEAIHSRRIDALLLLQPTAPLRTVEDIDKSLGLFLRKTDSQSLISAYDGGFAHPRVMYTLKEDHFAPYTSTATEMKRRQEFEDVYIRNGAIYIARRDFILKNRSLICDKPLAYVMPRQRSINIDEPFDLFLARCLIERASEI